MDEVLHDEEADRRIDGEHYGQQAPRAEDGEGDGGEHRRARPEQPEVGAELAAGALDPGRLGEGDGGGGGDQRAPARTVPGLEPGEAEQREAVRRGQQAGGQIAARERPQADRAEPLGEAIERRGGDQQSHRPPVEPTREEQGRHQHHRHRQP